MFLFSFSASVFANTNPPKKEATQITIVVQFKPNNCTGDRDLWSIFYQDLNAALAQLGPSMAVTEIVAHSYELAGVVPLCGCRYNSVLNKINFWSAANGVGPTTSPLVQGCVVHPSNFAGNPPEHMQVIVKVDAFL